MKNTKRKDLQASAEVEKSGTQTGVAFRMLGVAAIVLGVLDSMLSWRGGFAVNTLFLALILGGAMLFIAGSLVRNR